MYLAFASAAMFRLRVSMRAHRLMGETYKDLLRSSEFVEPTLVPIIHLRLSEVDTHDRNNQITFGIRAGNLLYCWPLMLSLTVTALAICCASISVAMAVIAALMLLAEVTMKREEEKLEASRTLVSSCAVAPAGRSTKDATQSSGSSAVRSR